MSSQTLAIAIAGVGRIGRAHAGRIRASRQSRLLALADPSEAAAAFANTAHVPLYSDLEALLHAESPDGLILATPNGLHVPGALACIERGIPVLVEKPVADTMENARRLVDAVE